MYRETTFSGTVWAVALAISSVCLPGTPSSAEPTKLSYNRDIRPILAENCFACHGPDSASRKGELRLDRREDAVKSKAITPGDLAKSGLVERIGSADAEVVMPPPSSHKTLTAAQKAMLKRWITEGAEYQPHWSLIPATRPTVPAVKAADWVRNPIDAFVLAELEQRGLSPAPEADRRTLARRAALDITGLPPEPADVDAFVADARPDAYERYLDKLFASPQWGEHRGRYWLDYARYGDTHGIHFDNYREMWAYRDWVIGSFNANMPFDQFTIEQLAGDLLANPTLDQRIATGFNRCNITTNEGGIIDEEYLVLYTRDRTETAAQVWMGLTAGCAVCHDHKFDPLSMRDFYSLAAFFNNTTQGAKDGNIKDSPPVLLVPAQQDRERYGKLASDREKLAKSLEARRATARSDFDGWLEGLTPEKWAALRPNGRLRLQADLREGKGKDVTAVVDGKPRQVSSPGVVWAAGRSPKTKAFQLGRTGTVEFADVGDFERDEPFTVAAWVRLPKDGLTGAIVSRMDESADYRGWDFWIENNRIGTHIVNAWPGDALKVVANKPLTTGKWHHVVLSYDGSSKSSGVRLYIDGDVQTVSVQADKLHSTIRTSVSFKIGQRTNSSRINQLGLEGLRIYGGALSRQDVGELSRGRDPKPPAPRAVSEWSAAERQEAFAWWLVNVDKVHAELAGQLKGLDKEEAAIRGRATIAHVMQERREEPTAFILTRGEYDRRGEKVKAATPPALPPMPAELPRNRLGLAQWLLRPEHPLTARVTVNRYWQEVFGTGLVRTAGDFGVTGELPSHPALLDWLAVEYREAGWDTKRFFKLILTSATYRQSAATTPAKLELDAANRWLSRGPRFRMDAEMIRDAALASSGLLVRTIGGPSVKPYQPEGVWEAVAMIGSNTRNYKQDAGDAVYRRSLYTFWKRSAPPASLEIFNAPNRETACVRRERTNTPLQALVTLNDVQYIEAARALAEAAMKAASEADGRIDYTARRLLSRPLRAEELTIVRGIAEELLKHYREHPAEAAKLLSVGQRKADAALNAAELAAWTMVVNQLMNLDEVLCK